MTHASILILAGEASGDYHAAALVRDIKQRSPHIRILGIGGEKLADAGMELLHHYREINMIGLSGGLATIRNIIAAYRTMKRELRSGRHHLFIPVDFPDVNMRLCRVARTAGLRVCYYISPQVWAWRRGRVRKLAKLVDRMMTIFPFEQELYREAGVDAYFVGHTMVRDIPEPIDRAAARKQLNIGDNEYVVALLPGSRPPEVRRMLPMMCEAAEIFAAQFSDTRFVLPLAGGHLEPLVRDIASNYQVNVKLIHGEAASVMAAADCGLVCSGTATLQAALTCMPHAVVYKVDPLTWWIGRRIVEEDVHLAIANMLAIEAEKQGGPIKEIQDAGFQIRCRECGRPLFVPELLQKSATPEELAQWLVSFRTNESLRRAMVRGFHQIRAMLAPPKNGPTAAEIVLGLLESHPSREQ